MDFMHFVCLPDDTILSVIAPGYAQVQSITAVYNLNTAVKSSDIMKINVVKPIDF